MTGKVFGAIVGIAALFILAIAVPVIPKAAESFRTDTLTQEYTLATGATATIGTVVLANPLWNADVSYVVDISSDLSTDAAVADNYTSASKALNLTGLTANTSRTLSVDYRTAGLADYPAADSGATFIPALFIGLVALVPLALLAAAFTGRQ